MVLTIPTQLTDLKVPTVVINLKPLVKSVNFHITKACNYRCKFCYAHFNQVKNHLSFEESKTLVRLLKNAGTQKFTFVGGEPTLVKFLPRLIKYAKELGKVTMIVTNGSCLDEQYIESFQGCLDWVGLDQKIILSLGILHNTPHYRFFL